MLRFLVRKLPYILLSCNKIQHPERSSSRDIYESRQNIADRIQWPPTRRMNGKGSSQLQHPEAAELEKKLSDHDECDEKNERWKVNDLWTVCSVLPYYERTLRTLYGTLLRSGCVCSSLRTRQRSCTQSTPSGGSCSPCSSCTPPLMPSSGRSS